MNIFNLKSRIIVTCPNRISPWLSMEVKELGFKTTREFKTGVELHGTLQDCIKLNLQLRCASQVLFSIKEFKANKSGDHRFTVNNNAKKKVSITHYLDVEQK